LFWASFSSHSFSLRRSLGGYQEFLTFLLNLEGAISESETHFSGKITKM
jgi:hypothetical protein